MFRIEPLENRIAPASLLTFTDVDGDKVTIKVTVGDLANATLNKMATGSVNGEQLLSINLTHASFEGTSLSITAVRNPDTGGDGFVNVGQIIATGRNLGAVIVDGDLGQIDAGNDNPSAPAIKSLAVNSLGEFGDASGSGNLQSDISGALGSLTVKSNLRAAVISVSGGENGTIGNVKIGGSVIGGSAGSSGAIIATGTIGPVLIGGNLQGGSGAASGQLFSNAVIKSVTINGSFLGGSNLFSGIIEGDGGIGVVKIGGRMQAFGASVSSAQIVSGGTLGPVTIGHELIGSGQDSAQIHSTLEMGAVKIGGDFRGGDGANSGRIFTDGSASMGGITIGGSVRAGMGSFSASIKSGGDLGFVSVKGDFIGGGVDSASIRPGKNLAGLFIGGNFEGGSGTQSARILGGAVFGNITIGGNVIGGAGTFSATIAVQNIDNGERIGVVKIGGNIIGGSGGASATITGESMKSITVGGSVLGGSGPNSAEINGGNMSFVRINGSVDARGFANTAVVTAREFLPTLFVGGLLGGATDENGGRLELDDVGTVTVRGDMRSGVIAVDAAKSLTIGGSVLGGAATRTGYFEIFDDVGSIKIGGDLRGGAGINSGSIEIDNDVKVGSLSIGGGIYGGLEDNTGLILGDNGSVIGKLSIGGDVVGGNGDAVNNREYVGYVEVGSIGTLTVGGSIIAGTNPGAMDLEESGGINTVSGGIQSLMIKGSVLGNPTTRAVISTYAETSPGNMAFGKIAIGGSVVRADILGGFDYDSESTDDAQIGKVTVGGDWIASNLVAGIDDNDGFFGDANDSGGGGKADVVSRIASITILGAAYGTPSNVSNMDRFAFTAEFIGSLKVGGTAYPLNTAPHDQNSLSDSLLAVGPTGDLRVREL